MKFADLVGMTTHIRLSPLVKMPEISRTELGARVPSWCSRCSVPPLFAVCCDVTECQSLPTRAWKRKLTKTIEGDARQRIISTSPAQPLFCSLFPVPQCSRCAPASPLLGDSPNIPFDWWDSVFNMGPRQTQMHLVSIIKLIKLLKDK